MSDESHWHDRALMQRAVQLARKCQTESGKSFPSPKVGAVIARKGRFLGEAHRGQLKSGEHAEYTLMEKMLEGVDLSGATLYTTLEPCTSRGAGKTPCAKRCIDRGLEKVFIGTLDVNPLIRGHGQNQLLDAGINIGAFDPDLMHTLWKMNRDFRIPFQPGGPLSRSESPTRVGPNGHPVGYAENGNLVEWIPDDEEPGGVWPLLLQRNDNEIREAYRALWDQVWWYRNQFRIHQIESGLIRMSPEERRRSIAISFPGLTRVEGKYGQILYDRTPEDWAILEGQMSALSWALGAEWNESFDT